MRFMAEKTAKKAAESKAAKAKPTKAKAAKPKAKAAKARATKAGAARAAAKPKASASKAKTSKSKAKASKSGRKPRDEPVGDMGIVIVDDDLTVDREKINEERRAYLEEARSQEAFD